MNLKEQFLRSYSSCIDNMDMASIHPYTEHEYQRPYSKFWYDSVILPMLEMDEFIPINPSVLRSMLVMDLIDLHFLGIDKNEVFEWYCKQLYKHYDSDIFSLRQNVHNKINTENLSDYVYFANVHDVIPKILVTLNQICYKKYFDIFADSGYETLGPFYSNKRTHVIYKFDGVIPNHNISIIGLSNSNNNDIIDLFGHTTITPTQFVLELNGDIILDGRLNEILNLAKEQLNSLPIHSITNAHTLLINNRLCRYPKNICEYIDYENLSKIKFVKSPRILIVDQLLEFVTI